MSQQVLLMQLLVHVGNYLHVLHVSAKIERSIKSLLYLPLYHSLKLAVALRLDQYSASYTIGKVQWKLLFGLWLYIWFPWGEPLFSPSIPLSSFITCSTRIWFQMYEESEKSLKILSLRPNASISAGMPTALYQYCYKIQISAQLNLFLSADLVKIY